MKEIRLEGFLVRDKKGTLSNSVFFYLQMPKLREDGEYSGPGYFECFSLKKKFHLRKGGHRKVIITIQDN
ncbi:MAG: hypothetical protein WC879_03520 [Melioribacteraceae bacterium]